MNCKEKNKEKVNDTNGEKKTRNQKKNNNNNGTEGTPVNSSIPPAWIFCLNI